MSEVEKTIREAMLRRAVELFASYRAAGFSGHHPAVDLTEAFELDLEAALAPSVCRPDDSACGDCRACRPTRSDLAMARARIAELEEQVVKAGAGVSAVKAALEECLERNAALKKDCERFVWNLEACRDLGDLRGGAMFDARVFDKEWVHPAFESVNRMYQDLRKAQGLRVKEDAKR